MGPPTVQLEALEGRYSGPDIFEVEEGYHSDVVDCNSNALFIIPKGTKYIAGWFNTNVGRKNYVSETIKFVRKIS